MNLSLTTTRRRDTWPSREAPPQPTNQSRKELLFNAGAKNPTYNPWTFKSKAAWEKILKIQEDWSTKVSKEIKTESSIISVSFLRDAAKELYNTEINEPSQLKYSIGVCGFFMTDTRFKWISKDQFIYKDLTQIGKNIISSPLFKNLSLTAQAEFISMCLQWDNEPYMNIDSLVEFAISSLMNALVQKKCTPEEKDEIIDNLKRSLSGKPDRNIYI
ncbi:MAG: hypothetical protein KBD37_05865, partial [Burkholderiales bacterium]|nr:hypothetical protein [Burkholderiales bacterium]